MNRKSNEIGGWKDLLFNRLKVGLAPLGFRLRKGEQAFQKWPVRGIRHGIHFNFAAFQREPRLDVIVSVDVRHDAVERLTMGWRTDISPSSKRESATIGQELGHLVDGHSRIWHIISTAEVAQAADEIWHLISTVGLPYLETFSKLEEVLTALSSESSPYTRHFPALRCHHIPVIRGILYGWKDAIPCFNEEYSRLKKLEDPNLKEYPIFVSYVADKVGISIPLD